MKSKFYDEAGYSYVDYWKGRDYEHLAEEQAIRRLLGSRRFKHGIDVGGGYGRLTSLIAEYCDLAELVEPSDNQRTEGAKFLANLPNTKITEGTVTDIPLPDHSVDLILLVRVLHHIPNTEAVFKEFSRVLEPGGHLLLEVANSTHFKARLRSWLKMRRIPRTPIAAAGIHDASVTFVNHHPKTIREQLEAAGFMVETKLSVSNLRLPGMKRMMSPRTMARLERFLQRPLSFMDFGPSTVFFARKKP